MKISIKYFWLLYQILKGFCEEVLLLVGITDMWIKYVKKKKKHKREKVSVSLVCKQQKKKLSESRMCTGTSFNNKHKRDASGEKYLSQEILYANI